MIAREKRFPVLLLHVVVYLNTAVLAEFPNDTVFWTAGTRLPVYSTDITQWLQNQHIPSLVKINIVSIKTLDGIAFDIPKGLMVTSDAVGRTLQIHDLNKQQSIFFLVGTSKDVGQVTIDWRARNVYWADTGFGWIAMKQLPDNIASTNSLDTNFKVVVSKYLDQPTGIAVHPNKYFLFWADAGVSPKIERSDLVGQNRTIITWQSLIKPIALCIDQSKDRLYWTDSLRGTIEYSDFYGNSRKVLVASYDKNYYGLAIFKNTLLYTSPKNNQTGSVSLTDSTSGQQLTQNLAFSDYPLYQIAAFDVTLQPRALSEGCDSDHIGCSQICVHMPVDRGGTCFCQDGYQLLRDGKNCSVSGKVLERHLLFTNRSKICATPISVLGLDPGSVSIIGIHCDSVTSDLEITRFALDMSGRTVVFTDGRRIYKQLAFSSSKTLLYNTTGTIIDMDYDWKNKQLYWIESGNGYIYYMNISYEDAEVEFKQISPGDVVSIAVDPHNKKVFWIEKNSTKHWLNVWNLADDTTSAIRTTLLNKPTDLEYDKLNNRLLWNDDSGFIGTINTDGTGETKPKHGIALTTGKPRHAVTVYKHFIVSTTAENRQFDILYELSPEIEEHLNLSNVGPGPVLDVHVYDSTLQPTDLDPCEVNNGGCEHICLPEGPTQCACRLGYVLDKDGLSCKTGVIDTDFYVVIDKLHKSLYQISKSSASTYKIEIDESNTPTQMAFDFSRNQIIWTDSNKRAVKKKTLGSEKETAVLTGVDTDSSLDVDVSTGNIYISTGGRIVVIGPLDDKVIIQSSAIGEQVQKIALNSGAGKIAWLDPMSNFTVVANMDGSDKRKVQTTMQKPKDIMFDLDDLEDTFVYWCDSGLDKIERINVESLGIGVVYSGQGLRPVAMDIIGNHIYLAPDNERKIVRIDKTTGLDQQTVFESPLFGTFNNFFVSRPARRQHALCGICNGKCSNVCLPKGNNKVCACGESDRLAADKESCENAGVCPQTFSSDRGFEGLVDCCTNLPNAVCRPKCSAGYDLAVAGSVSMVSCRNGKWNTSLTGLCRVTENGNKLPVVAIAAGAGGGGGAAILIIIIVIVVCVCRKRKRFKARNGSRIVEGRDIPDDGYAAANGIRSPDPPPRKPEPVEEEEYNYLDESAMVDVSKLRVDMSPMPPDKKEDPSGRRSSTGSGRYSKFPGNEDYNDGYLTASYTLNTDPQPDYPIEDGYSNNRSDGYLVASSVGSNSIHEFPSGWESGGQLIREYPSSWESESGITNPAFRQTNNGEFAISYRKSDDRNFSNEGFSLKRDQDGYLDLGDSSRLRSGAIPPPGHR